MSCASSESGSVAQQREVTSVVLTVAAEQGSVVCGAIVVVVTSASLHATPHQRACCERPSLRLPAASGARDLHPASMVHALRVESVFAVSPPSCCRASFSSSLLFVALRSTACGGASPLSPPARLLRTPVMRTQHDASALCTCTWNLRARIEACGSRAPPRTRRGFFCMGMGGNNAVVPHFLRSGSAQLTQRICTANAADPHSYCSGYAQLPQWIRSVATADLRS